MTNIMKVIKYFLESFLLNRLRIQRHSTNLCFFSEIYNKMQGNNLSFAAFSF